jgi:hypothetical protein
MKEYRNAITHATFLDISKYIMWKTEDGFPTLKRNFYILPDNPNSDFMSYKYDERITLFGFLEEMGKIFDEISKRVNQKNLFNKYEIR